MIRKVGAAWKTEYRNTRFSLTALKQTKKIGGDKRKLSGTVEVGLDRTNVKHA